MIQPNSRPFRESLSGAAWEDKGSTTRTGIQGEGGNADQAPRAQGLPVLAMPDCEHSLTSVVLGK